MEGSAPRPGGAEGRNGRVCPPSSAPPVSGAVGAHRVRCRVHARRSRRIGQAGLSFRRREDRSRPGLRPDRGNARPTRLRMEPYDGEAENARAGVAREAGRRRVAIAAPIVPTGARMRRALGKGTAPKLTHRTIAARTHAERSVIVEAAPWSNFRARRSHRRGRAFSRTGVILCTETVVDHRRSSENRPPEQSTVRLATHHTQPRATIGQSASTRSPRTQTYQSYRFTVGSQ